MLRKLLRRLVEVSCLCALLFCSPFSGPLGQPSVAKAAATTGQHWLYVVAEINAYEQLAGQPQWLQSSQRRFASTIWQFNDNGTFAFAPTVDTRKDLYPLWGKWTMDGDVVTFYAKKTARTGNTGSATAEIAGSIDFSQAAPLLTMTWSTSAINAAVINGGSYGSNSLAAYQIEATLQPYGE